jgi:hypothetical protein
MGGDILIGRLQAQPPDRPRDFADRLLATV